MSQSLEAARADNLAEVIDSYPRGTPDRDDHPRSFHVPLIRDGAHQFVIGLAAVERTLEVALEPGDDFRACIRALGPNAKERSRGAKTETYLREVRRLWTSMLRPWFVLLVHTPNNNPDYRGER